MESVWWVVKKLWDKGWIYRGEKVVPFSTALGTVLSNFEAGSKFHRTPKTQRLLCCLRSMMTTPTSPPGRQRLGHYRPISVCVSGPDIDYVEVFDETIGAHIILAGGSHHPPTRQTRRSAPVEQMKGSALAGLRY